MVRLLPGSCSVGVCEAAAVAPVVSVGGVVDLFLRRPAICGGGSGGSSGDGEPDIGGEGKGAQLGAGVVFDKLNSNANFSG